MFLGATISFVKNAGSVADTFMRIMLRRGKTFPNFDTMSPMGLPCALNVTRLSTSTGSPRTVPLLAFLSTVGTAAMLWVGGQMVVHGAEVFGLPEPAHTFGVWSEVAAHAAPMAQDFVGWAVKAALDGIVGLILGLALIPLATRLINPIYERLTGNRNAGH